ncbi:MAG: addiction module protein [Candidatus Omnitrophica bacterium]|nr:addiction module protein [Candidatus Omnitrophota bacterium]
MLTKKVKTNVLELNAIDRIHLAEILLDSLDKTDEQIEKIWVRESENRYQAYKEGRVKGRSLKQLQSRIEK